MTLKLKKYLARLGFAISLGCIGSLGITSLWAGTVFSACSFTVTNTNDSGAGSLRQAITSANNNGSSLDTICFNIAGGTFQTIMAGSMFMVTQPVIIDGTTQPGYAGNPVIEIDGQNAGSGSVGFDVTGGGSTIKGLVVNRFSADGIILNNNGGNTVQNNYVGTNSAGTVAFGNGASGIGAASPNNTIGGTTPAERNIVAGNAGTGIAISGSGASGNVVEGNYVGTDPSGTTAIPNGADGILITNAPNNTIGGTTGVTPGGDCTGACNLSSGNTSNGIGIWQSQASGNVVTGNYVGVNIHGTGALPNQDIGFEAQDAPNNTIGGTTPAERNIFSGNLGAGVSLTSTSSTGNVVEGNYIGVDVSGQVALGNHKMGVNIGSPSGGSNNASSNTIGGTTGVTPGGSCTGSCNVISGNSWSGIYISGNTGGANSIVGNFIGPSASGGLDLGNVQDGVGIVDSANNHFGGPVVAARNLISGNGGNGVAIVGASATGTRIEGNYIGEGTDGGCMSNHVDGVADQSAADVAIINNPIFCSGFLGVDLNNDGVTHNHTGNAGGANESQNYPVLTGAYPSGSNTVVLGSLNGLANTSYRIDIFSSPYCDRSSHGQGQTVLGNGTVTTDGSGNITFQLTVSGTGQGVAITTTATKVISGTPWETSEFSACVFTPRQHPDGTYIRPLGSQNIFLLVDGHVEPVGLPQILMSYGIQPGDIKTATTADTNLTGDGSSLFFRDGTLLRGSDPTVYVIDQPTPGSYAKRQIVSAAAFNSLGYTAADVLVVPDGVLSDLSDGAAITDGTQHANGTLVKDPNAATLYWLDSGEKDLVGSVGVFVSQRFTAQKIKTATTADLGLSDGSNLEYAEGRLVKGSGPSIYVIVNDTTNGYQKRPIGSIAAFTELGYNLAEVITIPDNELPATTGSAI